MLEVRMTKNSKSVFMFSGQGSQYYFMGLSLYRENLVFRKTINYLDELVKSISGYSVLSAIYDQTKLITEKLDNLAITHPAIFMIQYAMVKTLESLDIFPDIVLGYSLGEYSALTTAGVINPEEALGMILSQAKIVRAVCDTGFMYAILANHEQHLPLYSNSTQVELASKNFQQHFVLAGLENSESKLVEMLNSSKLVYFKLPIQYGFHSSAIEPAIEPIKATIDEAVFKTPMLPIASCTKGHFLNSIDNKHFQEVFRAPIQFQKTIQFLENKGQYRYIDIGPSDTLSIFTKYIINKDSKSKIISTLSMQKNNFSFTELKSDLMK